MRQLPSPCRQTWTVIACISRVCLDKVCVAPPIEHWAAGFVSTQSPLERARCRTLGTFLWRCAAKSPLAHLTPLKRPPTTVSDSALIGHGTPSCPQRHRPVQRRRQAPDVAIGATA